MHIDVRGGPGRSEGVPGAPGPPRPRKRPMFNQIHNTPLLNPREMALELVSGAEFLCKLMCGAGPVDLRRTQGPRGRPDPQSRRFPVGQKIIYQKPRCKGAKSFSRAPCYTHSPLPCGCVPYWKTEETPVGDARPELALREAWGARVAGSVPKHAGLIIPVLPPPTPPSTTSLTPSSLSPRDGNYDPGVP